MRMVDINTTGAAATDAASEGETWVMDSRTRRADPAFFDDDALAMADRGGGIRPCLVAMPAPLDALERRVSAYRAAGAPDVLRICPGPEGHGYPLESWALSPIPEYCERHDLALVVDVGSPASGFPWADIVSFARDYPRLTIVSIGAPLSGPTAARALDATPNLVLETSALSGETDGTRFAELVRSCGAYRFVYGSNSAPGHVSVLTGALAGSDARIVLAGTADHLADGTWGSTYL